MILTKEFGDYTTQELDKILADAEPEPDPEMDAAWANFLKSLKENNN